ncbi:sigma-E factor negative regulatory protein [Psychromonas antarctica]|uniref:sigma-E factor negative regulatory protein n=1 Tax=Psychromonas antarctica TaxID=67573 RepID=UPI001EE8328E|nr:RseA family anti-sigma factor [Psychromonas antarctica]MCG6201490.1 anti-sigma 24 factor [Psychromonas antarctica]
MKDNNEQLSTLIDNEIIDHEVCESQLLDELITNKRQQAQFSRYHLVGDVMRGEVVDQFINIDISQQVMARIEKQAESAQVVTPDTPVYAMKESNNIVSFAKRFSQYAIAASVAGIVVLTSIVTSQPGIENNEPGIEVLNTVPFGGAVAPVSLQASHMQSKQAIKEHNERLDALLKDHQLQLQTQP